MSIRALAPAFTLKDARAAGFTKDQVYALLERDEIERVGRGSMCAPKCSSLRLPRLRQRRHFAKKRRSVSRVLWCITT